MSPDDHFELPLARDHDAPRRARAYVGVFLDARGVEGEMQAAARLIVSELVTNAVLHAVGPITFAGTLGDDMLRVEVCDGDDRAAVAAARPTSGCITGRGLVIIDAFAHRWGVRRLRGGKSVWAEISVPSR
jgi:anti-sigma regulatory factor (Ser/Thr protein kinase)